MFVICLFFFFKQKTAYEMRISDWSSDVCSSDLFGMNPLAALKQGIVDHVRSAAFITLEELRAVFHRDARAQEFTEAYNDLMRIKQLTTVQQSEIGRAQV